MRLLVKPRGLSYYRFQIQSVAQEFGAFPVPESIYSWFFSHSVYSVVYLSVRKMKKLKQKRPAATLYR